METKRRILRSFTEADWQNLHEISIDCNQAPGPDFDRWPTTEDECRDFARYLAEHNNYYAMCLRATRRVVGSPEEGNLGKEQNLTASPLMTPR